MAFDTEVGQQNLRSVFYDKMVKGFAERAYKFKQAVTISSTSAWKNYFFRENATELTGQSGNAIKGIARNAEFPQASVSWERVQSVITKYGLEDNIPYEDLISDEIDVRNRTVLRIASGVAKAVDDEIYAALTENGTPTNIQSITIVGGYSWDSASAAIIDNLEEAEQKIAEYNYPTSDLMVFVSPKDKRKIVTYLYEKGAQAPELATNAVNADNGVLGRLGNKTFIVSNSVTASQALVVVPKRCATWKEMVPLSTTTKEDPYKSLTIRTVEMGVTQLTDVKAVVLIKGTQA